MLNGMELVRNNSGQQCKEVYSHLLFSENTEMEEAYTI